MGKLVAVDRVVPSFRKSRKLGQPRLKDIGVMSRMSQPPATMESFRHAAKVSARITDDTLPWVCTPMHSRSHDDYTDPDRGLPRP
jgi:hypothetical protein